MIGVVVIIAGLAWLFSDRLFDNLGGVGEELGEGADEAVVWLQQNNSWVKDNEDAIRDFLEDILPAAKDAAAGLVSGLPGGLSLAAQLVHGALLMRGTAPCVARHPARTSVPLTVHVCGPVSSPNPMTAVEMRLSADW